MSLKDFLLGLKHKTVFITALLFIVVFIETQTAWFNAQTTAIIALVSSVLLIFFKIFAPTGELPKGWSFWFYLSNGLIFIMQAIDVFFSSGLFTETGMDTLIKIQVFVNGLFSALQVTQTQTQLKS